MPLQSIYLNGGMIGATMDFGSTDRYVVGTTTGLADITVVGSVTDVNGGTITLPAGIQQNDIVFVFSGAESSAAAVITSGYTTAFTKSPIPGLIIYYKVMGATPDTTVVLSTSSSDYFTIVAVFRGVDTTTPIDVAASNVTGLTPPARTTVTDKAMVLILPESGGGPGTITSYSTGFTEIAQVTLSALYDGFMGLAQLIKTTAGTVTPTACGFSTTAYTERCTTLALRPAIVDVPVYGNYKNSGIWSLSAILPILATPAFVIGTVGTAQTPNSTTITATAESGFGLYLAMLAADGSFSNFTDTGYTQLYIDAPSGTSTAYLAYSTTDNAFTTTTNTQYSALLVVPINGRSYSSVSTSAANSTTPPSVACNRDDIIIIVLYVQDAYLPTITVPSGYTLISQVDCLGASGACATVIAAYKQITSTGTETPGAWGGVSGADVLVSQSIRLV